MNGVKKARHIKNICPRCEKVIPVNRIYCVECERELGLTKKWEEKKFSKKKMIPIFALIVVMGLGIGMLSGKFVVKFRENTENLVLGNEDYTTTSIEKIDMDSPKQKMMVGTVYDLYLSSMKSEDMYSSAQYAILDINKDGTEELLIYKESDASFLVYTYVAGKVVRILNCPSAGLGHEFELCYSDKYEALVSYNCTSNTREDVFYRMNENSFVYIFTLKWEEQRGDNITRYYEYQDNTSFHSLGSYIVSGKDYNERQEEKNRQTVLEKYDQYMGDIHTIDFYFLEDYPDSQLPQEKRIENIRMVYYSIQNNLQDMKIEEDGGITYYIDETGVRKINAAKGSYHDTTYPAVEQYNAEYYYMDDKLIFVFVYRGTEEYRFYLEGDSCIRYIDKDGNIQNYENKIRGEEISDIGYFCRLGKMELQEMM